MKNIAMTYRSATNNPRSRMQQFLAALLLVQRVTRTTRRTRFHQFVAAILVVTLLAPCFPRPAHAATAPGLPNDFNNDAALGIPETGGAVTNGSQEPVSVNPSTGAATVTVPFRLPTARGRVQPRLALSYSSSAGAGGVGGWGWSLNVPSIQRAPLSGAPSYNDPGAGASVSAQTERMTYGDRALVPVCTFPNAPCNANTIHGNTPPLANDYFEIVPSFVTNGWSYFRLETGADDGRFFWSPDHLTWVVQFKTGETLEFGNPLISNASSVSAFPASIDWDDSQPLAGTFPFRWNLVRQYDSEQSNGVPINPIMYRWTGGFGDALLYLTDIYYTFAASAVGTYPTTSGAFANHVRLVYESDEAAAGPAGFLDPVWRARPHSVLARVDISAVWDPATTTTPPGTGGTPITTYTRRLVRRYWLTHQQTDDFTWSNRVQLTSVQIETRCDGTTNLIDLEAADGTIRGDTNCYKLPPTSYGYVPTFNTVSQISLGTVAPAQNAVGARTLFDVNTDGIPDILTMDVIASAGGSVAYLVSANGTADTLSSPIPLIGYYSAPYNGYVAPSPNWPTYWQGHTPGTAPGVPVPAYPHIVGNFGTSRAMTIARPAGFAAPNTYQFDILTPAWASPAYAWQLTGTSFLYLTPPNTSSTPTTGDTLGYFVFGEAIYGVTDVDGDGLPDALTDTGVAPASGVPGPFGPTQPYQHYLAVHRTTRNADGTILPFAAPMAGAPGQSFTIPTNPLMANFGLPILPVPSLPPTQQYTAAVTTIDCSMLACRLLGDPEWMTDMGWITANNPTWGPESPDAENITTFFADMNGDGLEDWVTLDNNVDTAWTAKVGRLLYWVGHGDGTYGSCASGKNDCTGGQRFAGSGAATAMPGMPTLGFGDTVYAHDVTGDGFTDLVVATTTGVYIYVNAHGAAFGGPILITGSNTINATKTPVDILFGDMNGSGVDDIVLVYGDGTSSAQTAEVSYVDFEAARRPGLLQTISNGYGATSTIYYQTTADLARQAIASGHAWGTSSPQISHHVTKIVSTNGFEQTDAAATFAETRTTEYAYANPTYDERDHALVGFQTVTRTDDGDPGQPMTTRVTRTSYFAGVCAVDNPGATCPSPAADRPYLVLRGRPYVTDVYDGANDHLTTTHQAYTVRNVLQGVDGRVARFAFPSQVDSFVYDSSLATVNPASSTYVPGVVFDDGSASVTQDVLLYSTTAIHRQKLSKVNTWANLIQRQDEGQLGVDAVINETFTWGLPPGDVTGWQWRMLTSHRDPFPDAAVTPASGDLPRDTAFTYYADGQVQTTSTTVAGELPLLRVPIGGVTPPMPTAAVQNGQAVVQRDYYDAFGNIKRVMSTRCVDTQYDPDFAALPTTHLIYRDGCLVHFPGQTFPAVSTSQSWDRGLEAVLSQISPSSATTRYVHDILGRVTQVYKPDPLTGFPATTPTITARYLDQPPSGYPYPVAQVQTTIGSQQKLYYLNAWGETILQATQADPSAGDDKPWIVSGVATRNAQAMPTTAYAPYFWDGLAQAFPLAGAASGNYRRMVYDGFGRLLTATALDGTPTIQNSYHYLERDTLDADQLRDPSHAGAYSKIVTDGHGRAVRAASGVKTAAGGADEIRTDTVYSASGQPLAIIRSHTSDATQVVRTVQYDSLGNIVANNEPNTTSNGVGWRYAYDANGALVGTSDARGCGENLVYDGAGRLRYEDYAPCTPQQAMYTAGPLAWAASAANADISGAEVAYFYDVGSVGTALNNQLSSVYDRGSSTFYTHDERARVTAAARYLASPTWTSAGPLAAAGNYSTTAFYQSVVYDDLDRLVGQSTGADVPALLGTDVVGDGLETSRTMITGKYSLRGVLSSVQGSYGTLLQSNILAADGAPLTAVLGDAASTTVFNVYNANRQLLEHGASRNRSLPQTAHPPLNPPSSTVATAQSVLIDDVFTPDFLGIPQSIADNRIASEWTAGSVPAPVQSRSFIYDDLYRLTQATYSYATSSHIDAFQDPFPVPTATRMPMALTAPTGMNRVMSQTFTYDWLGNLSSTLDDHKVFFDRSLGNVTNGSASQGPNQLQHAQLDTAVAGVPRELGRLQVSYDAAGNMSTLSLARQAQCSPSSCASQFTYSWDEVGRLAEAFRFDGANTTPSIDVQFAYDHSGQRVLRAATENGQTSYTAEVFPSLRLNQVQWDKAAVAYDESSASEVVSLALGGTSLGRVIAPGATSAQHVLLELGDALGSTAATVDKASGELVERTTYYPYGAVESDYRAPDLDAWGD